MSAADAAQRPRLVVVVHGYPPAVGGVEFAVRDICEGLVAQHGWRVTVLTTDAFTNENFRDPSLPRVPITPGEVQNGVEVRRFPVETRWMPLLRLLQAAAWRGHLPGNSALRTWYQGPISPGLREAARSAPAEVVLATSFPLNHVHYAFNREDGVPVALLPAVHPWDRWGYERRNLYGLARRAAAVVALTSSERDWLRRRGVPPARLQVLPLGVRVPDRTPPPGMFRQAHGVPLSAYLVAYVGQQGSHKGIDSLIASLPRLLGPLPDAWLAIAGAPTPYSAHLRELASSLPSEAARRLVFLDRVDESEKAALLNDCDVFASPSRNESFGLTVLEAWAYRKPVVAGEGPAQRELLEDGRLGDLVPYADIGALVSTLARLASEPERRLRLGQDGHARLRERYTLASAITRFDAMLRALIHPAAT